MNYFDVLVLAFGALAFAALYLTRPATFIFAGNNLLVARALSAIEQAGPPSSQRFIATYVFASENLTTASWILTFVLLAMIACTLLMVRERARIGPAAPAVPRWLIIVVALYLVAYTGARSTVFTGGHVGDGVVRYDLELAGGHTFLCSFLLYELARRRLLGLISARRAFGIMFVVFFATGYARGGTGIATGYLVTAAILLLPRTGAAKRFQNVLRISAVLVGVLVIAFVVRGVRATLAAEGTKAISTFVDAVLEQEKDRDELGEGAENVANATQSASHMLECIDVYESGVSREWRSIYNVVEYTFMPSVFVRWFDWTRSIEPAWELGMYHLHGGGINVLGELYWNGGFLCVVIMASAIAFFCTLVDTRCRRSPFWLMMAAQFCPSFFMGYGYGFPQVARGAINGLLALAAYKIYIMIRPAQGASHEQTPVTVANPGLDSAAVARPLQ